MKPFDPLAAVKESIWNLLRGCGLLSAAQVEELRAVMGGEASIQKLVEAARERGWVNEWQCRQLLSGRREFRLGKYQLVGSLGEGGMGTVFLAEEVAPGDGLLGAAGVVFEAGCSPASGGPAAPVGSSASSNAPGGGSSSSGDFNVLAEPPTLADSPSSISGRRLFNAPSSLSASLNAPPSKRRQVALKLMAPRPPVDAHALARFLREVKAGASLQHPNIVATLEADRAGAKHFLVMEYVRGRDLSGWLRKYGPLPIGWACECIRQACLGLQHAHERGVVHRDLKPENILVAATSLAEKPVAKLLDLGLAKFTSDDGQHSQITSSGQIIGTIDYMSLEQVDNSKHVDIRADIYALGTTLFKVIAGALPFPGKSVAERLHARRTAAPCTLSQYRTDVPPGLDPVVAKAIASLAHQRYASPQEFADALAPFSAVDPSASVELRKNRGAADEISLSDFLISDVADVHSVVSSPGTESVSRKRLLLAGGGAAVAAAAFLAFRFLFAAPATAGLLLDVEPGVEVFVDGRRAMIAEGTSPRRLEVPAGRRQLQFVKPGFAPHTQNLNLPAGEDAPLKVTLVRIDPRAAP